MGLISTKLRNSAKGELCTFAIPGVCNHDSQTTVLCHAPSETKGMGNKGPDYHAAFGCYACHEALDQHRFAKEDELRFWLRGIERTHAVWINRGLIVLPVDPATAKTRPGKKANLSGRPIQNRSFRKDLKKHMDGSVSRRPPELWRPSNRNVEGD
jgi:hypothetical protein